MQAIDNERCVFLCKKIFCPFVSFSVILCVSTYSAATQVNDLINPYLIQIKTQYDIKEFLVLNSSSLSIHEIKCSYDQYNFGTITKLEKNIIKVLSANVLIGRHGMGTSLLINLENFSVFAESGLKSQLNIMLGNN
ncbi:hypothetical protein BpHYR1_011496 [Brachionus plicatilis]|uniref:Uncharacterized protein n=1 Tax=Brachionus plicatilis TaxID=10195 RepID=A0A3M7S4B1_BRAPC|nr:hypothetical protein BpHYR1_011496 [Brachionus plicatilis]